MRRKSTDRQAIDILRNYFGRVEVADRDADLDFDPLTAAAWENITKSGNGTINWNAVFGVPAGVRAVFINLVAADDAADSAFTMRAKLTTVNASLQIRTQVANQITALNGLVPVAPDGTSYYSFGGVVWTLFYLRVVGWIR